MDFFELLFERDKIVLVFAGADLVAGFVFDFLNFLEAEKVFFLFGELVKKQVRIFCDFGLGCNQDRDEFFRDKGYKVILIFVAFFKVVARQIGV